MDALAAEDLDQTCAQAGGVGDRRLAHPFEEAAGEVEARHHQVLEAGGQEAAGARRHVGERVAEDVLERSVAPPAHRLLEDQADDLAHGAVEETLVGDDRRVPRERLPEPCHLARRLAGGDQRRVDGAGRGPRDHRRTAGEPLVREQPLVDADLERPASAAAREHEAEPRARPVVSSPPLHVPLRAFP